MIKHSNAHYIGFVMSKSHGAVIAFEGKADGYGTLVFERNIAPVTMKGLDLANRVKSAKINLASTHDFTMEKVSLNDHGDFADGHVIPFNAKPFTMLGIKNGKPISLMKITIDDLDRIVVVNLADVFIEGDLSHTVTVDGISDGTKFTDFSLFEKSMAEFSKRVIEATKELSTLHSNEATVKEMASVNFTWHSDWFEAHYSSRSKKISNDEIVRRTSLMMRARQRNIFMFESPEAKRDRLTRELAEVNKLIENNGAQA